MKTETENTTIIDELKKEFAQTSGLLNVTVEVQEKLVYLKNESWGMRNIRALIQILFERDITFMVVDEKTLILYKIPITVGDSKLI